MVFILDKLVVIFTCNIYYNRVEGKSSKKHRVESSNQKVKGAADVRNHKDNLITHRERGKSGNQREKDRERAAPARNHNGNRIHPEQRRERDGKALQEKAAKAARKAEKAAKAAKKAEKAAGSGDAGGKSTKK